MSDVFSYRFSPSIDHGIYDSQSSWNKFWLSASEIGKQFGTITYCDISDFYNQIYHHTVENQLIESGLPNQAVKWIIALLESTTAGVSRGVPIGPHAAHIIAEASLIPIDNSMSASGLRFVRYADDIIIFSENKREANRALARLASILDKQQRLTLQRHKTQFFEPRLFVQFCRTMIEDRPINSEEQEVLNIVKKYSNDNPYIAISYNEVDPEDWGYFSEHIVGNIIREYILAKDVDYIRLRWFYRRLAQIGHPGALNTTLQYIESLKPCFASICSYIASLQSIEGERWLSVGAQLIELLNDDDICDSEYFRLSILSLFSRNSHMNHFNVLSQKFDGSDAYAKREILLAAKTSGAVDWIRELKENFENMDRWQKMAFLFCCSGLPMDERKYFINRWKFDRPFENVLAKWAKRGSQPQTDPVLLAGTAKSSD